MTPLTTTSTPVASSGTGSIDGSPFSTKKYGASVLPVRSAPSASIAAPQRPGHPTPASSHAHHVVPAFIP